MKKDKKSLKIILSSMITFQLLFMLFAGFIVVEKNTRKIGFADYSPWVILKNDDQSHFMKFKFMGKYFTVDFSEPYQKLDSISKYIFFIYQKTKK